MDELAQTRPPRSAPRSVYVLAAHPHMRESRVSRRLFDAARSVEGVVAQDLYGSYPDFDIDVPAEQSRAEAAELVVLLHPVQWYSATPLLKLWFDEVLTYGWAYGTHGTALAGKDLWLVASTGGPETSYHPAGYNRYFFDAFLPPYEQTAALCGMRFLPAMMLHGAHRASDEHIAEHARIFGERLSTYPDWPELADLPQCPACYVPTGDRPGSR
jgi:glutathione-regulated potassium-efflux system ancillary protein KefF